MSTTRSAATASGQFYVPALAKIVGSGAAGMTAALTAAHLGLSALVIEKAAVFGGSTARSGGGIWAPGNSVLRAAGVADTPEQARAYLAHVAETPTWAIVASFVLEFVSTHSSRD